MENLFIILGAVALFVAVLHVLADRRERAARQIPGARRPASARPRRLEPELDQLAALVTACLGDRQKAQRLIDHERRRAPGITDRDAIARALERLASDRGR